MLRAAQASAQEEAEEVRAVEEEDTDVHEEVRDQGTDDDTVGLHEEAGCEAVPDDRGRVGAHEEEHREIPEQAETVVSEAIPGDVEVDETTDHEHHEVENQVFVIVVLIDEADVHEDQHDVDRRHQPHRAALLRRDVAQRHEDAVEDAVHEHRHEQKTDEHPVLVLVPDFTYGVEIDAIADDVVERQQEQNRGARERHLVEGFDELVRPRIHRIEQRPAGTTVWAGLCRRIRIRPMFPAAQTVVDPVSVLVPGTTLRAGLCVEVDCIGLVRCGD